LMAKVSPDSGDDGGGGGKKKGCCCQAPEPEDSAELEADKPAPYGRGAKRKCTDIIFLLAFFIYWFGLFIVLLIGMNTGDPARLLYGTDYEGAACGGADYPEKKLIYYPRMNQDLMEALQKGTSPLEVQFYGICVSKCPALDTFVCNYPQTKDMIDLEMKEEEKYKFGEKNEDKWFSKGPCWYVPLESKATLFRCFPKVDANVTDVERCVRPGNEGGGFYAYKKDPVTQKLEIQLNDPDLMTYYTNKNRKKKWVPKETCKTTEIESLSFSKRPTQPNPLVDNLQKANAVIGRIFGDLQATTALILINGAVLALVFGFVFLLLLKYCAGPVVWLTVCLVVFLFAATAIFTADKAGLLEDQPLAVELKTAVPDDALQMEADQAKSNQQMYKYAAFFFAGATAVLILMIIAMRKKIKISIGIIRQASAAVRTMPMMIVFPLVSFLAVFLNLLYFMGVAAMIESSAGISASDIRAAASQGVSIASGGKVSLDNITAAMVNANVSISAPSAVSIPGANGTAFSMKELNPSQIKKVILAYHLLGFLWTNNLINAISMCTIAGAVCRYYWARKKTASQMGAFPVVEGFYVCFRYHMGSLCFGSLIIAIVQFIRIVMAYVTKKLKPVAEKNKALKALLLIINCCLWCVEKVIKFISRNAYITIAMTGKSFCGATVASFLLILNNFAQVGVINAISAVLLLLAKLSITAGCALITFSTIESDERYAAGGDLEVSSPVVPVFMTTVLAFFVATTFINIFELAIDTILICFCEDKKVNESSGNYYMSEELQTLVLGKKPKPKQDAV